MTKDLVEYIVKTIVEKPDSVEVTELMRGETTVFEISVDTADRGKVIGREGHTIKTLRSLVGIVTAQEGKKVTVDIAAQP